MIEAWQAAQGGMGGAGPLPFAGGWAEQPAGLAEAFRHLSWADAQIRKLGRRRPGSP